MAPTFDEAIADAVRHYLARVAALLDWVETAPDPARLLATTLAPDMFDTGTHMAVAIGFAGRALATPAEMGVPDIPEDASVPDLRRYLSEIEALVAGRVVHADGAPIRHIAGEADLMQDPADYLARFAFPNMLFHLSLAYAGLRAAGLAIGKADFDGLHRYAGAPAA